MGDTDIEDDDDDEMVVEMPKELEEEMFTDGNADSNDNDACFKKVFDDYECCFSMPSDEIKISNSYKKYKKSQDDSSRNKNDKRNKVSKKKKEKKKRNLLKQSNIK